jgi:hypothetical protein
MKVHEICPSFDDTKWRKITPLQKAEFQRREFFTDEVWVKWKQELDVCMSFRKSIKGKPTPEQMFLIDENSWNIKRLKRLLFGPEFS